MEQRGTEEPVGAEVVLRQSFEEFGLTGHEARVLVGILIMGSASALQLARYAGVARANVYRMLEGLSQRGLASPLPGSRSLWTSPGREEVVTRLCAAEERRHRALESIADRAREVLSTIGPEAPVVTAPHIRVLRSGGQLGTLYRRLVGEARQEVLVLNHGPYGDRVEPYPEVLAQAGRIRIRALYEAAELDQWLEPFRAGLEAYHAAGVEGRVVDHIPIALAIIDRRHVLTALQDTGHDPAMPTPLHVEHPEFAEAQVTLFDHLWSRSRPYLPRSGALDAGPMQALTGRADRTGE